MFIKNYEFHKLIEKNENKTSLFFHQIYLIKAVISVYFYPTFVIRISRLINIIINVPGVKYISYLL